MPDKKLPKVQKTRDILETRDILAVSQIISMFSGFMDIQHFSADELEKIVKDAYPEISADNISNLITATNEAVSFLVWNRQSPKKLNDAIAKYEALAVASTSLANDLMEVLSCSNLEGGFRSMLFGSGPELSGRIERADRIRDHLANDLWWLRRELDLKIASLRKIDQRVKTPEYECVYHIGSAWISATDRAPAVTRNQEARCPQATPFQRYVAAAIPSPKIGESILRKVAKLLGDLDTAKLKT